jgi:hypothetical protein
MISKQQALDRLSLCYDQANIAETPDIFFLDLYSVMEEYDTNPALEKIGQFIKEKQKSELDYFYKLDGQVKKEMRAGFDKIKCFVATHKIINPRILEELDIFESSEKFPPESGLVTNHGQLLALKRALLERNTEFTLDFLRQLAVIDENGEISSLTFIPSFSEWDIEDNKIRETKRTRIWYAWFELVAFYNAHNPEAYAKKDEIEQYKRYLRIIYHFTKQTYSLNALAENEGVPNIAEKNIISSAKQSQSKKNDLSINYEMQITATLDSILILSADGKGDIPFKVHEIKQGESREPLRFRLLLFVYENPAIISRKELREKLQATDKEINTARRGINDTLSEKWHLKDNYLLLNKKRIPQINDKYPTEFHRAKN